MRPVILVAMAGMCGVAALPRASAQSAASSLASRCATHAPEAGERSGLPAEIILRVMRAESDGNPGARSHKGAMGCMQIMPATWAYLTRRYRLGDDPYAPRMNMIGGALYLAELGARFGFPGAYSAYNAGPERYARYLAGERALPPETLDYAAKLGGGVTPPPARIAARSRWQDAGMFLPRSGNADHGAAATRLARDGAPDAPGGLFALPRTSADRDSASGEGNNPGTSPSQPGTSPQE